MYLNLTAELYAENGNVNVELMQKLLTNFFMWTSEIEKLDWKHISGKNGIQLRSLLNKKLIPILKQLIKRDSAAFGSNKDIHSHMSNCNFVWVSQEHQKQYKNMIKYMQHGMFNIDDREITQSCSILQYLHDVYIRTAAD